MRLVKAATDYKMNSMKNAEIFAIEHSAGQLVAKFRHALQVNRYALATGESYPVWTRQYLRFRLGFTILARPDGSGF